MKKELLFATGNQNKVKEIRALLEALPYTVVTMAEIGFYEEIPETGKTLEENALIKAQYLYEKTGRTTIAEDTGLEVEALSGAPGVHTARYAGPQRDTNDNMDLLLSNLEDKTNRKARFRTVIALIENSKSLTFEGIVNGSIGLQKSGKDGFGYDPVFIPDGEDKTFAEMDIKAKSAISHRGRALEKLIQYLSR